MNIKKIFFVILLLFNKGYAMKITSPAFAHNAIIPKQFTGEGKDHSPTLQWQGAPQNTQSFVVIVDDPDAPSKTWVHWVVYNIPSGVNKLEEGVQIEKLGAKLGKNDSAKKNYAGPMPPQGHGKHRYFFKIYALDTLLNVKEGATKQEVEQAMKGHILDQAELIGLYERK